EDLKEIYALTATAPGTTPEEYRLDVQQTVTALATKELSPFNALEAVQAVLRSIAIDRPGEAQPVMPLATISVTEDMATSMRLHGLGWKSVYHHELLADGLAPEDVGSMLTQRLRWAQGTMQVLLRENPLAQWGMTLPQRLMYFATMWTYLSGYAALVYFAAPIVFLVLGILPVDTNAFDFFVRFVPFILVNQLLFLVAGRGVPTWRGQQYSLALFPIWIKACTTAFQNVALGTPLGFAVTPKTRQETSGRPWHLIRPQLVVMVLLVLAILIGLVRVFVNGAEPLGTSVNIFWAVFDLIILSVLFRAVSYRGYSARKGRHK
ncbi:MAG: glycosyltransferase, partial [Mycetocola sp.]